MCFFFKQKTAYEMRISDWSSDVCSSDLRACRIVAQAAIAAAPAARTPPQPSCHSCSQAHRPQRASCPSATCRNVGSSVQYAQLGWASITAASMVNKLFAIQTSAASLRKSRIVDPQPDSPEQHTMAEPATDYAVTAQQAEFLADVCMLPAAERLQAIRRWRKRNGYLATLRLFAQFIGAANAIVANNRIAIEDIMIEAGIAHPCRTVGFNQPTIPGVAAGAILSAMVDQAKTCAGCAYRLGTPANTSPVTTEDARH